MIAPDLHFVPRRTVVGGPIDVRFALRPGDRPLVAPGDTLVPGSRILDRVRDARLVEVRGGSVPDDARPGDRWSPSAGSGIPLRRGSGGPIVDVEHPAPRRSGFVVAVPGGEHHAQVGHVKAVDGALEDAP